jgi:hypothetical protein
MSHVDERLIEAEKELLFEKIGRLDLQIAEGAWTGSHGGHDPDFEKLRGGLKRFWIERAAKDPHPFTYCVRHLRKHVANPERLCAWLKDQALNTTKWRKGDKKIGEAAATEWQPSVEELREALLAYEECARELGIIVEGDEQDGDGTPPNEGGSADGAPSADGDGSAEAAQGGEPGATPITDAANPPADGEGAGSESED